MNETHFVVPLQGCPSDRYRHRHTLAGGTVGGFVVQGEARIEGEWHEIVRYDTAHGSPHKDILHPDGTSTKEEFPHYTRAEVMTLGQTDIRKNWQKYRERCERELRRLK